MSFIDLTVTFNRILQQVNNGASRVGLWTRAQVLSLRRKRTKSTTADTTGTTSTSIEKTNGDSSKRQSKQSTSALHSLSSFLCYLCCSHIFNIMDIVLSIFKMSIHMEYEFMTLLEEIPLTTKHYKFGN